MTRKKSRIHAFLNVANSHGCFSSVSYQIIGAGHGTFHRRPVLVTVTIPYNCKKDCDDRWI